MRARVLLLRTLISQVHVIGLGLLIFFWFELSEGSAIICVNPLLNCSKHTNMQIFQALRRKKFGMNPASLKEKLYHYHFTGTLKLLMFRDESQIDESQIVEKETNYNVWST